MHSPRRKYKLKVIYKEFSSTEIDAVALLTPAKSLSAASSCVSSKQDVSGKSPEKTATSSSMVVVMDCPRYHMYVLVAEADPTCPNTRTLLGG